MKAASYDVYSSLNQKIIDAFILGVSCYWAYWIRFEGNIPAASRYQMWLLLPVFMLGQVLVTAAMGNYRLIWRYLSLTDAIILARGYGVFAAILLLLRFGVSERWAILRVPLSVIVLFFLLSLLFSLAVRALRRRICEGITYRALSARQRIPVLLLGAGRAGAMVARQMSSRSDLRPIGFLDDDRKKQVALICGLPVLGPVCALVSIVQQHNVREIIVCIPKPPREMLKLVWAVAEQALVQVKVVPTLEEILQGKLSVASFRDVQMKHLLGRESVELSCHDEVASVYNGKTILITGAGGSIGGELAHQLAKLSPRHLILLDKDENGLHDAYLSIKTNAKDFPVSPIIADLRCSERVQAVFSSMCPEVVFHAAAHKHVYLMEMNPSEAVLNNILGTRNLISQVASCGVERFVFISTDKAVKPTSIMGATKRICEMIVQAAQQQSETRLCCVRFGNVLGSRGSVVPTFIKQIANGGPVTVTHPEAERFLMTISEAVGLLIQAGTLASSGEIFTLDMGQPVLIQRLATDLIELSGLHPGKDIQIHITRLGQGEKLRELLVDEDTEALTTTAFGKIHLIGSRAFDTAKFIHQLEMLENAARTQSFQEICSIFNQLDIGFQPQQSGAFWHAAKPVQPVLSQSA